MTEKRIGYTIESITRLGGLGHISIQGSDNVIGIDISRDTPPRRG